MLSIDFEYYRCPNAQRRFRKVADHFASSAQQKLEVKTIEPRAESEFPAFIEHYLTGVDLVSCITVPLSVEEKSKALEFDELALSGNVNTRWIFCFEKVVQPIHGEASS